MTNYGNGFNWTELYHMPIHWRRFYFNKLLQSKKKEKEEYDKSNNNGSASRPPLRVKK